MSIVRPNIIQTDNDYCLLSFQRIHLFAHTTALYTLFAKTEDHI